MYEMLIDKIYGRLFTPLIISSLILIGFSLLIYLIGFKDIALTISLVIIYLIVLSPIIQVIIFIYDGLKIRDKVIVALSLLVILIFLFNVLVLGRMP